MTDILSCFRYKKGGYNRMKNRNHINSIKEQIKRKEYLKWYYIVLLTMFAITFFRTVYALIVPAITLEKNQEVLNCLLRVHQHTEKCYDENGTLICGQADFVIHTHNGNCYNADDILVCSLPEKALHEHTDDCYEKQRVLTCTNEEEGHIHVEDCYQIEKTLVCTETTVLHIHNDVCYDENEMLICGMLQLTEHTHSEACFSKAEETATTDTSNDVTSTTDTANDITSTTDTTNDVMSTTDTTNNVTSTTNTTNDFTSTIETTSEVTTTTDTVNEIMLMSETANEIMLAEETANSETWGYNDDGSIWWKDTVLQQFPCNDIEKNNPYVIAGNNRNHVLTNTLNADNMSTFKPNTNIAYKNYEIWCFEKYEDSSNKYYIYDDNKKYIKMSDTNNESGVVSLTDKNDASVFTVEQATLEGCEHCVTIKSESGKYINISGGDDKYCNNYWCGWSGYDAGSCMQILKVIRDEPQTAKPFTTVSSPNTVINLFDYWAYDKQEDRYTPDNLDADLNAGINKNHAFKFSRGTQNGTEDTPINRWTGSGVPLQGIVKNQLVDKYPAISGSTESLEYLFNLTDFPGKKSYRNVSGLLSIDTEGYYYFDSGRNSAEFDEKSNSFKVYNTPLIDTIHGGQFFPFNSVPEFMYLTKNSQQIRDYQGTNHYFGLTITTRFIQQYGGHTDENKNTKTVFEFSGDDDVWIFIDDVLVGDLGGIHDKADISIDFSTGNVEINGKYKTNLKQCYIDAQKLDSDADWSGSTYADNTVHTLKFFYLERGNYDSHMHLKYNLTEIPQTAIYKVDQYDQAVPEATFAVYPANEHYEILNKVGGTPITDTGEYDDNGNLVDSNRTIITNSLYTGTTNQEGEMIFVDDDGMPYSINELQSKFGNHFILREIKVPEGYRVVTKDVHLQIWKSGSHKILKCDNTEQSGSRASPTMQITATDTLYLYKPYKNNNSVLYCDNNGKTSGTLFAVVFKYVGNINANGEATEIDKSEKWVPVYGSDKDGYHMVDMKGKEWLDGVLESAKEQEKGNYGKFIFELSPRGTMQLTLKNLPGHITTYYHILADSEKNKARYTVAYYWTDTSLANANKDNTYQVDISAGTKNDKQYHSGFELVYGADIHVPNLVNKVFVQKVDEENNLIDGATFAIYEVKQLDNREIQYLSKKDSNYHALTENAVVSSNGNITDGDIIIEPANTAITRTYDDGIHTGTAEFIDLSEGQYIIKEVNPPPGYKLNTADVMLLVTEDTIYANAGTADDGVTVGRGPGYLVTPMSQYASSGQIDNTLTWVYAQMKISEVSDSFADAENVKDTGKYLSKNFTSETNGTILKTHLIYDEKNAGKAFNYVADPKRNVGVDSDGHRRLFTDSGWSYYEIYQDYEYGISNKAENTNYKDWHEHPLTNLFSRSTYIRVMDELKPTLKVKKTDVANPGTVLSGAEFRLYKKNVENGTKLYYYWNSNTQTAEWSENENDAFIVTTGEDGMADKNFIELSDGDYYLEEVKSPDGYLKLNKPIKLKLEKENFTPDSETLQNEQIATIAKDENNKNLYIITVYNSASFELPATGGNGTLAYTITGILLMAVSLVCGLRKIRRSKREMK